MMYEYEMKTVNHSNNEQGSKMVCRFCGYFSSDRMTNYERE
jgi:hypothetical protein